jgi:hypothetical protein
MRDLSVIGFLQLAALTYGVHTIYLARPVVLVFEVDRFRALSAADIDHKELQLAPPNLRHLSLTGPRLIGSRLPRTPNEQLKAIDMGFQGIDIGQRPRFWQPYEMSRSQALKKARPVAELEQKYPAQHQAILEALQNARMTARDGRFLPLTSRTASWVTILDRRGYPAAFLPLDGFF